MEIPGVNNVYLLKAALNAKRKAAGEPEVDAYEFLTIIRQKMKFMQMSETFLTRGVNEGFSGGEKKRNEVLQMLILEPRLAILDETDSGLDIDALKVVANEPLRPGEWNHLLVTYDGSGKAAGVRIYVNGRPQATSAWAVPAYPWSPGFTRPSRPPMRAAASPT